MPIHARTTEPHGAPTIALMMAADLQDNLMIATNDLDRLQTLLTHACDDLLLGFHGAIDAIRIQLEQPVDTGREAAATEVFNNVMSKLAGAVTALQFQDMASQLIAHTHKRLRSCADRVAREAMIDDEDGVAIVEEAPMRPNPVTQDEMDAGSIELF